MEQTKNMPETFKSESSIIVHPYKFPPKELQMHMPTWALLVILIVTFFILKFFIYIADQKRHGK